MSSDLVTARKELAEEREATDREEGSTGHPRVAVPSGQPSKGTAATGV